VGAPVLLIGVLAWPMLFTNSYFVEDWLNHLWYMWHQSLAIRENHLPSLFLNYSERVFYPHYAFYGGTIYVLAGVLSLLLGNAPMETYVLTYLLSFAASYGGWYWIARIFGLGHWRAQAPGLVFITSGYYLTLIYARGDWPEFLGVSMIPLMVAAGLSIVRADRLRLWPAVALAGSAIVFFGSHNLTIVWGSTVLALVGLAIVACVPQARRSLTRSRVIHVACLIVPAALVSAWYLLPAVAYQSRTLIGNAYPYWRISVRQTMDIVSAKTLFTLSRLSPGSDFAFSLPILVIAWVLVSMGIFLLTGRRGMWMRVLMILSGATVLITVVMTHAGLVLALPRAYATLQFTYRLETYVLLGLSGAVLAVLVLAEGGARRVRLWTWMLVPILIFSVVGAIQQVSGYPHLEGRSAVFSYLKFPTNHGVMYPDYLDVDQLRVGSSSGPAAEVHFPPAGIHGDHASAVVHLRPGQLVDSNIGGGPELVHVTGARIVGVDTEGNDALEVEAPAASAQTAAATHGGASVPAETISVSTADSAPVVVGRLLSVGAVIVLVLELVVFALRRVALRRRLREASS
jgi:hypothetical protein